MVKWDRRKLDKELGKKYLFHAHFLDSFVNDSSDLIFKVVQIEFQQISKSSLFIHDEFYLKIQVFWVLKLRGLKVLIVVQHVLDTDLFSCLRSFQNSDVSVTVISWQKCLVMRIFIVVELISSAKAPILIIIICEIFTLIKFCYGENIVIDLFKFMSFQRLSNKLAFCIRKWIISILVLTKSFKALKIFVLLW